MTAFVKSPLRLGFAGDLLLGGEFVPQAARKNTDLLFPFRNCERDLAKLDLFFVNLEGPLFKDDTRALKKHVLLQNDPRIVELLKIPGTTVCSLANNHSMDFGTECLLKTQQHLEQNGILHLGAGTSIAEAERELIVEKKGWKIGCFAFTSDEPDVGAEIASEKKSGCASFKVEEVLRERIRTLKAKTDIVVVLLHWGVEFSEHPTPEQVRLSRSLAEAGADFVIGHHPHVLQPIEQHGSSVIAYSLGHFFVPSFRAENGRIKHPTPESRQFVILQSELSTNEKPRLDFLSGQMGTNFQLRPDASEEKTALKQKLFAQHDGKALAEYEKFWLNYERRWKRTARFRKLIHRVEGALAFRKM